mmetsp:Transcript_15126/g.45197  ORF Transcript_15126/g.45197 Transcript_15126/m.45197 type:complete len:121 (+) Transcript_15126:1381-1743(+)
MSRLVDARNSSSRASALTNAWVFCSTRAYAHAFRDATAYSHVQTFNDKIVLEATRSSRSCGGPCADEFISVPLTKKLCIVRGWQSDVCFTKSMARATPGLCRTQFSGATAFYISGSEVRP